MATFNDIHRRALRLIQVLGADDTPTAEEAADGLAVANSMLDAWSIERLSVYQIQQNNYSWASGNASRTIGSGGNFNTTRPVKIEEKGNFFRDSSNIDYPVVTLERQDYDQIGFKSAEGSVPEYLYHDTGYPLMTLYAYPVPSQTLTLYLNTWKPLQTFTSLATTLAMPPGYQAAVEYNLALWMAPEYGAAAVAAAERITRQASILKSAIKAVNRPNLVARVDVPGTGRRSRIESDT